ncbi:hypothetical protein SASPL_117474 [Salvia splendens]|uniref:Pectate lyase N-terminal domain-containing protein n=1 Tax=Salvia splendens TaxID=180675 RepID=A0A8X8ZYY6_SALSN|nr:hypothetical protein SASPL_117474 [Salvia splendens]
MNSRLILFIVVGWILPILNANIGEWDEVWRRRADEAWNRTLEAYHPNPRIVSIERKRRRQRKKSKVRWHEKTSNAEQRSMYGDKPNRQIRPGGKGGKIHVVNDPSDDDVQNPKPGTLRHAVLRKEPLWITFDRNMQIKLKQELMVQSDKTIDGRGAKVEIAQVRHQARQFGTELRQFATKHGSSAVRHQARQFGTKLGNSVIWRERSKHEEELGCYDNSFQQIIPHLIRPVSEGLSFGWARGATRTELRQGSWSKPTVRENTAWSDAVLSARRQQHGQPRPRSTVTFLLPALMVLRGSDLTRNSDNGATSVSTTNKQRQLLAESGTEAAATGCRDSGGTSEREGSLGPDQPSPETEAVETASTGVKETRRRGAVPTESGGCESRSTHDAKGSSQRCSDSRAERPVGDSPISGQEQWFPD